MPIQDSTRYFATLPAFSEEIAAAIMERVDKWYAHLPGSVAYQRAKKCWQMYYGLPSSASPFDVSEVGEMGEDGENTGVQSNYLQTIARRALSRIVQQKLDWQAVGANGERVTSAQASVASTVLEYERRAKDIDGVLFTASEAALIMGESYLAATWNARGGGVYSKGVPTMGPDGQLVRGPDAYNGELLVENFTFLQVMYDTRRWDPNHPWVVVVRRVNRYDLATRHPGQTEAILKAGEDHQQLLDWRASRGHLWESDEIPVYTLYHLPSDSVPQGREVCIVDAKTVLFDGPSVYGKELPLIRMAPGNMLLTPHGSTPTTNVLALQELMNVMLSTAATNNVNSGIPTVLIPKNADMSPESLRGGGFAEYDGEHPPTLLELAHTAPQTFEMASLLKQDIMTHLGMSDVSMGQGDPKLSGAAMVMLDQRTLEFVGPFQGSYRRSAERLGTAIVRLYRQFKKAPRDLQVMVGESNSYLLKDFTGAHLGDIESITVETKNALADTVSGRLDIADKLIQMGALQGPAMATKLLEVMNSGTMRPMLDGPEKKSMLVKSENEMIARGEIPIALVTDEHLKHIFEHDITTATPEDRAKPEVMYAKAEHQNAHLMFLCSPDPEVQRLLVAMGQTPLPPIPPPGMPMLPPGVGGPGGPPQGGPPNAAPPMPPPGGEPGPGAGLGASAAPQQPQGPRMPMPPTNPATGQQWNPETGGA